MPLSVVPSCAPPRRGKREIPVAPQRRNNAILRGNVKPLGGRRALSTLSRETHITAKATRRGLADLEGVHVEANWEVSNPGGLNHPAAEFPPVQKTLRPPRLHRLEKLDIDTASLNTSAARPAGRDADPRRYSNRPSDASPADPCEPDRRVRGTAVMHALRATAECRVKPGCRAVVPQIHPPAQLKGRSEEPLDRLCVRIGHDVSRRILRLAALLELSLTSLISP